MGEGKEGEGELEFGMDAAESVQEGDRGSLQAEG